MQCFLFLLRRFDLAKPLFFRFFLGNLLRLFILFCFLGVDEDSIEQLFVFGFILDFVYYSLFVPGFQLLICHIEILILLDIFPLTQF